MELNTVKHNDNRISRVLPGSIAEEMDIECGDILLKINGRPVKDIIDYLFLISDEYLELEVKKADGEVWLLEIDKDYDEELGLEFRHPIMDHARNCRNKCIFCFIDQLPEGMRETLYFKDDDSRLSFLQGNFVTLTNMSDDELQRMIDYNISPINVSIHTTNPELRVKMLGNKNAGKVLERLQMLGEHRVEMNGQIVLCPGFNDGAELDRTLKDLHDLPGGIGSVAIVPIGLTKYREGLAQVSGYSREMAAQVIEQVEKWQSYFLEKRGTRFAFLSDEFYVLAGIKRPEYDAYEGFVQIENGVGLMTKLEFEVEQALAKNDQLPKKRRVSIATGVSAYAFIKALSERVMTRYKDIEISVYEIKNNFFGECITVAGLITGTDIISQLKNADLGECLILPKSMLKSGESVFLDDTTIEELEKTLNATVTPVEVSGDGFLSGVLGLEEAQNG